MSFNNPKSISSSIHHLKILTCKNQTCTGIFFHDNLSKQKHDMGFFSKQSLFLLWTFMLCVLLFINKDNSCRFKDIFIWTIYIIDLLTFTHLFILFYIKNWLIIKIVFIYTSFLILYCVFHCCFFYQHCQFFFIISWLDIIWIH